MKLSIIINSKVVDVIFIDKNKVHKKFVVISIQTTLFIITIDDVAKFIIKALVNNF